MSFGPIRPGEIDNFQFDFTGRIGSAGIIASVVWSCVVSPDSVVSDPDPASRIVGTPIFDNHTTTALCGNMLDGVIYTLSAIATLNDLRVLTLDGDVECAARPSPEDVVLTVEQFRAEFPAFANTTDFPDAQVNFFIQQALGDPVAGRDPPIDPIRWGQFYDLGLRLWVAHNLSVQRQVGIRTLAGAAPGGGIPQSRSVGPVSISYNLEFGMERDAGWYALSPYGNEFLRYLRMAGAAPIQL